MKKINLIVTLTILLCAFVSCDKIEGPYITPDESVETNVEFPDIDPATVFRKVLIEEYTGHRCTNCPDGHRELASLHERYGDSLVAIGIHAGSFLLAIRLYAAAGTLVAASLLVWYLIQVRRYELSLRG